MELAPHRPATNGEEAIRGAVIVAHPGHELRIHHWMERHRPLYCCLTDGSGGAGTSRLASTTHVLERLGAPVGALYGRYRDRDIYRLLLEGRVDVFVELTRELADALTRAGVNVVTGDAVEGFNPVHDVCRFLIDGALEIIRRRTGRRIGNYDFVLESAPDSCPEPLRDDAIWLRLDEAALDRKIRAARGYPELVDEVGVDVELFGTAAFAVECLRPSTTRRMIERFEHELPGYERHGQDRVDRGRYREVIRYRRHILPVWLAIVEAVGDWSDARTTG